MMAFLKRHRRRIAWFVLPYFALLFLAAYPLEDWRITAPGGVSPLEERLNLPGFETYELSGTYSSTYIIDPQHTTFLQLIFATFSEATDVSAVPITLRGVSPSDEFERASIARENADNKAVLLAYYMLGFDIETLYTTHNVITFINHTFATAPGLSMRDEVLDILVDGTSVGDDPTAVACDVAMTMLVRKHGEDDVTTVPGIIKHRDELGRCISSIRTETYYALTDEAPVDTAPTWIVGPSGGLMMFLQLYDSLIEEDLLQGRHVAGTGTLSLRVEEGEVIGVVGSVGGVKQKVIAADAAGAEIFFVPPGSNETLYLQALDTVERFGLSIQVVRVETWLDAIAYLRGESP